MDFDLQNTTAMTPYKSYKHKTINRFTVGEFEFHDHILHIKNAEEDDKFIEQVKGLLGVDQVNIVEIKNLENEKPLDLKSRVTRGSASSRDSFADLTNESRKGELDRREQELLEREANIANRERQLAPIVQGDTDPAPGAQNRNNQPTADSTLNPNSETAHSVAEANFKSIHADGTTAEEAKAQAGESTLQPSVLNQNQPNPPPESESQAQDRVEAAQEVAEEAAAQQRNDVDVKNDAFKVGGLKLGAAPKPASPGPETAEEVK